MKLRWIYLLFFALGVLVSGTVAAFQSAAGYMDADYYFLGGLRLAQGFGFTEPVIWNYLGAPVGIPQPSHGYWMPLASILAYVGILLTGNLGFAGARILFVACAGLLAPLTFGLALRTTGRKDLAALAGFFAVFSSFYLPFVGTTDTFGLYMLLGGLFFLTLGELPRSGRKWRSVVLAPLLLGVLAGLMHLARADGLIWLLIGGVGLVWHFLQAAENQDAPREDQSGVVSLGWTLGLLVAGYLLVMGPWLWRNIAVFGQPLAPGGSRALWLLDYNELFAFPPEQLTPARWWESGIGEILSARFQALGLNLGNAFAVQGQIFLAPLVLIGAWRLRADLRVQLGMLAWGLTLVSMTFLFPFPGSRGGFFHSGAALQPLFWALAPVGLDSFVHWGNRRRGWDIRQASLVFGIGIVVLAIGLSAVVVQRRVIGTAFSKPAWGQEAEKYAEIEAALQAAGAAEGQVVLINNPPGYYLASNRPAAVIPNGDVATLLAAAARYHVDYIILEPNHPQLLAPLYESPGDRPGLVYLAAVDGAHLYHVEP